MIKQIRSIQSILLILLFAGLFISCSSKQSSEDYNHSALYWYNKMISEVASNDIDAADDTFVSLQSEHKNSPLLATAMQIMSEAHINEEEYLFANYYLDEYIKKFALSKTIDYIRYLKIKANFLSFNYQYREQKLILKTMQDIEIFTKKYPNSSYLPLIETIHSRLFMASASLNEEISSLYERLDKPKAVAFYNNKMNKSWVGKEEIEDINVPWYRSIFE